MDRMNSEAKVFPMPFPEFFIKPSKNIKSSTLYDETKADLVSRHFQIQGGPSSLRGGGGTTVSAA
jgi:hypothetical protein